ncbi:MAG: trimethylamine methyltransferase family protein [Alphaproteobacteria bacterium]|nr:trimethylamine methyltransferase family protein [Alphaproteobacteria bacterium]
MSSSSRPRRRQNNRSRTSADRADKKAAIEQMAWSLPQYIDAPVEPVSEEILERIHDTSLKVLEEIGILFLNETAIEILRDLGCDIDDDTQNVRMDRELVFTALATTPSEFTLTPRNPDRQITVGGRNMLYSAVASAPNVSDLDGGRRVGTRHDYQNLLRLNQYFNCLHFVGGYPVEPVDLHASTRHLDAYYDKLTLTDKVMHAYSLGPERIEDAMEMVRIAAGQTEDEFSATPHMFTNINSSSPLKHDWPMLDGAMRCARRGQAVVVTPFTLSGAMAPATVMGALVQQNAEFLASLVLMQAVRKGTPMVYGAFTSNVDMKSGAPAFGTPEYVRAMQISGQLARKYKLPWRGSNANAANYPDGQAVWESTASIHAISTGHCNMVYHAAGWLEGGLCASFEKLIMDCELLQQNIYLNKPLDVSEDAFAFDAIREVGPGSHFFGADHTQRRFKDAFYAPFLSDWRNFESWQESGSVKTEERANAIMKSILAEFEPPRMAEDRHEELTAFVERRRAEGGAPTDF